MTIGEKIVLLRKEKGLSQPDLAKTLETSVSSLGRWERGETLPDAQDLKKIAEALGVTADFLLFDNVPRDGKVDITDLELLELFESVSKLDDENRLVVKKLLKAFVLREHLAVEFADKLK